MQSKTITLILFCIVTINLHAEDSYVDDIHNSMSDQVFSLSKSIDKILSGNDKDFNPDTDAYDIQTQEESIDSFFKTSKYINETEKTFLRINFNSLIQTKDSNNFRYKVRARLPLSRTKKSYYLFIDDLTNENPNSEITNNSLHNSSHTTVGVNYFAPQTYGVESKYSIGVSGFDPFIRARYNLAYDVSSWEVEPVQTFKYSADDKFEEETSIYFDKKIADTDLLRFVLYRHSQEKKSGMDYAFSTHYYMPLENHIAISLSQSFAGNTKYEDITRFTNSNYTLKNFGGIYNYATTVNFRQNVWKKWFFYEIAPGVNFHREYDYKANYSVLFSIDMYFGKTYKNQY